MKKVLSLMLVVMLCVGMMPMTVFAEGNESITYLDENGQQTTITDYEVVTPSITTLEGGKTYVVKENCTWDSAVVTVADSSNNPVKLILCDDAELTLTKGLNMNNADVIIYGQTGGTGKLTISTDSRMPTIDNGNEHRTLTVNGGIVTVSGSAFDDSRAIYVYKFVLNGGEVSATGGDSAESSTGIFTSDTIIVNGGKLIAKGGESTKTSFGIQTYNFTLTGGTVTAEGSNISGDNANESDGLRAERDIIISGGTLTATGGNITDSRYDYPISNGVFAVDSHSYTTNISDGTIIATGGNVATTAANSMAQSYGFQTAGKLNFSGGSITATAGATVAETTFSNPLSINTLNVSAGDLTLPKASRIENVAVSGDVKMIDLLGSGCALVHWGQKQNGSTTTREPIGATSLKDNPTTLTGIPTDTSTYTYGYFLVDTCDKHSYVDGVCEYCGTKQPASKPGGGSSDPTYKPTVTQPTVGGSVEVNNPAPTEGETVVVTPEKDNGYVIDTIKVTDENGNTIEISRNSDGTFDFTQPDGSVTIEVTYTEQPDFKDVPSDAWYGEALDFAAENGILSGTSKTTFEPDEPMTRAMFATVLWCYAGKPDGFTGNFSDIESEDWFKEAVAWASKNNVVSGTGNGKFEPDLEITREEMVVMLWNFCGKPEASNDELDFFTDSNLVSSWAQQAMSWAIESGVISGKGNGILDPKGMATRAEAACILVNYCGSGF